MTRLLLEALISANSHRPNHIFQWTAINSMDGIPKVWDEKADGYVRGETIGCVLLQHRSESKRIYATVLNTGINIDGYKTKGLNFPSSEMQEKLMVEVYKGAKVDPASSELLRGTCDRHCSMLP